MDKQDIIDGLDVILGRRGEKITQGDILIVEAAIMALANARRWVALPPELTAEMRSNVVEANRSRVAKGFEPFLKIGSEGWALELIYAELRRSMNLGEASK